MEVNTKMKLDEFTEMMTGHFDNKEQFDKMQAEGKTYPYAEHVNTICNDKIKIFQRISMADLLLKKATMKRMGNVMRHHIFFLLQKQNREFYFPLMKFQKEKIRRHFHMLP